MPVIRIGGRTISINDIWPLSLLPRGESGKVLTGKGVGAAPAWETPAGGSGTPSDTVPGETTFGITPVAGSATMYSRGDHTHGSPTNPVPDHAAIPDAHHVAFVQSNHDALPNPHHANSLDHTQGTDQGLDTGGANAVTAAQTKTAYTHSQAAHAPSNAQKNSDILKSEIEAKLTGEISSHTHAGGGGESEQVVVKVGDTQNATTTYADATGLSFTAVAGKLYIIEAWIRWATSVLTVGLKLSVNGPATPGFVADVWNAALTTSGISGGGGGAYNVGGASASAFSLTANLAMLNILFRCGATGGPVTVRFAAEATGTVTCKDGSVLRYRQVT